MQQSLQQNQPQRSPHAVAAAMAAAASSNGPASPPTSSSASPTSPPSRPWSIPKSEPKEVKDDRCDSPDLDSPTMVPRALSAASSLSAVPLTSLLQPLSPIVSKHAESPVSPPVHPAAPLSSLYGFPAFPLLSAPAYPGIPLHKQTLLSPLLASPHFWQAAVRHPLLSGGSLRPELDLMAEHKALMERFASSMSAAAALASREAALSVSPALSRPRSKTPEPPQNLPMDLSNKRGDSGSSGSGSSDDDDDDEEDLKSDVNRNVVSSPTKKRKEAFEVVSSR
jgi:hypothetical protein